MDVQDQGATLEVESLAIGPSMDDTIRETLHEIQSRDVDNSGADSAESAPESPEEAATRLRDASGKFATKEPSQVVPPEGEQVEQPSPAAADPAPNTWKKEAAAEWAALPPAVRQEVQRREADFHKGIEQYKQDAGFGQAMNRAIAPHAQTLQNLGVSADKAIGDLMNADRTLRFGAPHEKTAFFAQLAQQYGIDLGGVTQHAQSMPQVDPQVYELQNKLQQATNQLQQRETQEQQQAQEALNSEIEAFKADPKHSHFESVRGHMAALLQAGPRDMTLADAYEQAVYANPTTRAAMLQQHEEARKAEATKKAQAARQASSINTRARPAMPTAKPIGSMDDTIRDTYRQLTGAA